MRILHSSDWHLGAELEGLSRADEHQHFLDWLLDTMRERRTEVLLMAGDIYHQSHPSAAAQSMFFQFIRRLDDLPELKRAVFIGGNHDSPTRLEAPSPLYNDGRMTLIGGYHPDREDDLLVPITGDSGTVEMVVVAAPYVHEMRLRVNAIGKDSDELRTVTESAFREFYTRLGARARERWPNVPVIGMGHLTCGDSSPEDYGTPLHNVGTIESLPSSIFESGLFNYVALGHIHRGYRVGKSCANYSGAPLTFRFNRSELSPRQVVEVNGATGAYERLDIPLIRDLVDLRGPQPLVEEQLRALKNSKALDTWVNIIVQTDSPMVDPVSYYRELAPKGVFVVMVQQHRLTVNDVRDDYEALPDSRTMSPREMFIAMFRLQNEGGEPSTSLLQKFDQSVVSVTGGEHE